MMADVAQVSIVIPTHNRPQLLRRAVASVVAQTFRDWELLVVQNGGTRESEAVVEAFRAQGAPIRYLYEPVANAVRARNLGIERSAGEYIAFLDDDDEWLPEKLERQVEVLERDPDIGLVACRAWRVDQGGSVIDEVPSHAGEITYRTLVTQPSMITSLSSVLIRREVLERVGALNADFRIADDYDLYLRVARICCITMLKAVLYRYAWHGGNTSKGSEHLWREKVMVLRRQSSADAWGVSRRLLQRSIAQYAVHFYSIGVTAMDERRFRAAARSFAMAVRLDPLVGVKVPWSRSTNAGYRAARPFVAAVYCGLRAFAMAETAAK